MAGPPLFADDNSAWRRHVRKTEREERLREERRRQILDTLRRLKAEAEDPTLVDRKERARRHAEMLERYPKLF